MPNETKSALDRLLRRYVANYERVTGGLPTAEHEPAWPSPCEIGPPDADGRIHWQPRERDTAADFGGLERALDMAIHPDIKSFYGSFWADNMELAAEEGGLTLIQVWNDDDFDRLAENIIGHAMAKQRVRSPLTVFIAVADEGEFMLSVDNDTGSVVLEEPGSPPTREVSPTLAEFLDRLQPAADE